MTVQFESTVEMFVHDAQHHVWRKPNTPYQQKHFIPTVSTVVEWWWFGHLVITEWTMNSSVYQITLESHVKASVPELEFGPNWVINRTMIPSTENNQGPATVQSPDLNLTEKAAHMNAANLNELNTIKKCRPKVLHTDVRHWKSHTENITGESWGGIFLKTSESPVKTFYFTWL